MSAPRRKYGEGMMRPHGRGWQIRWYENGQPKVEQVLGTEREARDVLKERLVAVIKGVPTGHEGRKLTVTDLKQKVLDDYRQQGHKSATRVERAFKPAIAFFGERGKARDITTTRLKRYVATRLDAGFARATVQQEVAAVRRGFYLAVEDGDLVQVPVFPSFGKLNNARQEIIEPFEWALARPELPEWWQDLGDCGIEMGWRVRSELLGLYDDRTRRDPLLWSMVNWERGEVTKGYTKNGEPRIFPFDEVPRVKAALERRRAYTTEVEQRTGKIVPYVFHIEGESITDHLFYDPWRKACKRAGVFGKDGRTKRPHDFRRAARTALDDAGVSERDAMALLGHKTPEMSSRYNIGSARKAREALRKMHQPKPATATPTITVEQAIKTLLAAGITAIDGELVK